MTPPTDHSPGTAAELAWLAYQAMGESKKRYFDFLQQLKQKYQINEMPSIAENLKLEKLLREHDKKVAAFSDAMSNIEDPAARLALITKLSDDKVAVETH